MGDLSSHNNPLRRLWSTAKGHRLILENFLSLGLINVLNSSFHLIIYPILIRRNLLQFSFLYMSNWVLVLQTR